MKSRPFISEEPSTLDKYKLVYEGDYVRVLVDPVTNYEVIDSPPGSAVLPYFYIEEELFFVLRKEFKPFINKHVVTIITGRIDEGEEPEETALRELKEEAGFIVTPEDIVDLGPISLGKERISMEYCFLADLQGNSFDEIKPPTDGSFSEEVSSMFTVPAMKIFDYLDRNVFQSSTMLSVLAKAISHFNLHR